MYALFNYTLLTRDKETKLPEADKLVTIRDQVPVREEDIIPELLDIKPSGSNHTSTPSLTKGESSKSRHQYHYLLVRNVVNRLTYAINF